MPDLTLDKSKTVLLMVDFHADGMGTNPVVQERQTFQRAREVLDAARNAGAFVAYIVVNFRTGYKVSDSNGHLSTING
jgi:hypothetical protein